MGKVKNNSSKYLVCIQCMTFNQSKYILDTLNGFVMQRTNFSFVIIVVDDASTDGEQTIIKDFISDQFKITDTAVAYEKETNYAQISFAQHSTNKNCYIAAIYLKENHYSKGKSKYPYLSDWEDDVKYIAICEGDDYWIDSLKLQKQVDFLDGHQEYSAHTTNAKIIGKNGVQIRLFSNKTSRAIHNMNEIVVKRQFHTASVLWRSSCYRDINSQYHWDTYIWCSLLSKGKIWYDNSITCVYRKAEQGVTDTTPRIKWIEFVETWSNILFDRFGNRYLSYTSAYLGLTHDILSLLVLNKTLSASDKKALKKKYKEYANWEINIKNIPFLIKLYLSKIHRYISRVSYMF